MRTVNRTKRTHVEDVKDPDKVLLPRSNFILVTFGEDESVDRIPFTLFDDLPLDLDQSSAIEDVGKRIAVRAHCQPGSRSQPSNRIENRLVELFQLPSLQFPVEHLAHISASPPEVDEILIIGHRVLERCKSAVCQLHEEGTCPNHSQEDGGGAKGDLSWRDPTGVLGKA